MSDVEKVMAGFSGNSLQETLSEFIKVLREQAASTPNVCAVRKLALERAADLFEHFLKCAALSAARSDEWNAAIEAAVKAQCPDCAASVPLTKDGCYHLVAGEFGDDASVKRWCSSVRIHPLRRPAGEER